MFFGALNRGATCLGRLQAIRDLGHHVVTFDIDPYRKKGPMLTRTIAHRLAWGARVKAINRDLVKFAENQEYDLAWITKGVWLYPETIKALQKNGLARVLHFTADPAIDFHRTRHFIASLPFYDVCVTTKGWEVEKYRQEGAKRVVFVPKAVSLELFHKYDISGPQDEKLRSDVCIIGHYEKHYRRCIKAAFDTGADVAVWGRWQRACWFRPWFKKVFRGSGIWHENYAKALCSSKIGLGLLSKYITETSTARTFHVTACGTFLLAERTDEHMQFFEEGKEAEFFSSKEEMQEKIKYYLEHPDEREKIAAAGMKRCHNSGYGNIDRMCQCLEAAFKKP